MTKSQHRLHNQRSTFASVLHLSLHKMHSGAVLSVGKMTDKKQNFSNLKQFLVSDIAQNYSYIKLKNRYTIMYT